MSDLYVGKTYVFSYMLLRDSSKLQAMAHIDVSSRSDWTTCATSVESRRHLMLQIMTLTFAKRKISANSQKRCGGKFFSFHPCFGRCVIVGPAVHLLLMS